MQAELLRLQVDELKEENDCLKRTVSRLYATCCDQCRHTRNDLWKAMNNPGAVRPPSLEDYNAAVEMAVLILTFHWTTVAGIKLYALAQKALGRDGET
jgi:hypothetical protein